MAVRRGEDAEDVALGDRLPEQVDHRVVDGRVLDAGGREEQLHAKCRQFPSDTTSTVPSVTRIAVSSSIAYDGPPMSAAQRSAAAIVFVGRLGLSRWGKIEKSTTPRVVSPPGDSQLTKSSPMRGV